MQKPPRMFPIGQGYLVTRERLRGETILEGLFNHSRLQCVEIAREEWYKITFMTSVPR